MKKVRGGVVRYGDLPLSATGCVYFLDPVCWQYVCMSNKTPMNAGSAAQENCVSNSSSSSSNNNRSGSSKGKTQPSLARHIDCLFIHVGTSASEEVLQREQCSEVACLWYTKKACGTCGHHWKHDKMLMKTTAVRQRRSGCEPNFSMCP